MSICAVSSLGVALACVLLLMQEDVMVNYRRATFAATSLLWVLFLVGMPVVLFLLLMFPACLLIVCLGVDLLLRSVDLICKVFVLSIKVFNTVCVACRSVVYAFIVPSL